VPEATSMRVLFRRIAVPLVERMSTEDGPIAVDANRHVIPGDDRVGQDEIAVVGSSDSERPPSRLRPIYRAASPRTTSSRTIAGYLNIILELV